MTDNTTTEPVAYEARDVTHPGGMRAKRVFPTDQRAHFDPFVVFERFYIEPSQGFETHPHRGFEIVSYMLDGGMEHEDSMGHSSTATAGDAMRITTGSGMQHSEMPADGACSGLQLWINLPREKKDIDPSYQEVEDDALPVEETEGATITTVVGDGSPIDLQTPVEYVDVRVSDSWQWDVPDGWNGVLYTISGTGTADGEPIEAADVLLVQGGGSVSITTPEELRVAAIAGAPHGEPIRQRGPFVE